MMCLAVFFLTLAGMLLLCKTGRNMRAYNIFKGWIRSCLDVVAGFLIEH